MNSYLESVITVACAVGSWVVAGWVTVNVIKAKMEDMIRRIESTEKRMDLLYIDFNNFRLQSARDYGSLRRRGEHE